MIFSRAFLFSIEGKGNKGCQVIYRSTDNDCEVTQVSIRSVLLTSNHFKVSQELFDKLHAESTLLGAYAFRSFIRASNNKAQWGESRNSSFMRAADIKGIHLEDSEFTFDDATDAMSYYFTAKAREQQKAKWPQIVWKGEA